MSRAGYLRSTALVALAVALASCSVSDKPSLRAEKDRRPAPEFSLKNAAGEPVKLSDYRGKIVLLNFWDTWCEPCRQEIPWFISFEKEYKDRGFAVLGVSFDEDGWDAVTPYVQSRKMNYPVMVGGEDLSQLFAVQALPTTYVIDREGRIAGRHIGLVSKKTYQQEILTLLGIGANDSNPTSLLTVPGGLLAFLRAR